MYVVVNYFDFVVYTLRGSFSSTHTRGIPPIIWDRSKSGYARGTSTILTFIINRSLGVLTCQCLKTKDARLGFSWLTQCSSGFECT